VPFTRPKALVGECRQGRLAASLSYLYHAADAGWGRAPELPPCHGIAMTRSTRWSALSLLVAISFWWAACSDSTLGPSATAPHVAPPETLNHPPVIESMTIRGSKPREPEQFADLDETVRVSASISDAETPVSDLTLTWSSSAGTFSGTGSNVTWTAPHDFPTPTSVM
jgi:hypothetical protein